MSKIKVMIATKFKINPTPEQLDVLWVLSERCRLLYNFALADKKKDITIKYKKQQNELPGLKKRFPEYGWVHSKTLQMTLKVMHDNWKSYWQLHKKDKDARPPGFKGKKHFMSLVYNQSGFKFENGKLILNHYYNDVPLSFDCDMIQNVKQITVSFDKQFYVSVVYETEVEQLETNHLYQATDLGITKTTSVNMHGKFFESINPRPDKYWNKQISQIQSRRDLCKKNSRRWNVLNKKLQKMHTKRSNQMKDYQHKLSRRMVDNTKSNTLIIGDLSVKEMSKKSSKGMNRSTQNTGYLGRFSQFLTYKGNLVGKTVTKIDEKNTTKTCYVCGKRHLMQLRNRVMKCDCGNEIDRDKNSAINIMIRYLSQNALWTGFCEFRKNLRVSGNLEPQESRWFDETPPVRTGKTTGKFIVRISNTKRKFTI